MDESKSTLTEEINDESVSYTDDSLFNITSFGTDLSFREIISMYQDGDLEKPELQRKYIWTKNEASRFIDSILLGLPVPSIFLAKTIDEKRLIIDGYQRIMTVFDYVTGIFTGDGKIFKLSNTDNINERWRGKAFKELTPEEQRKIRNSSIHAIVFEQKHPQNDTGMFQIFERINTSGRVLKPQEIRNCVYHGEFNALLFKLNKIQVWRDILGLLNEDSRMADIELILRFFAINDFKNYEHKNKNVKQINLTKYMNEYMSSLNNIDEKKAEILTSSFEEVLNYLFTTLGKKCFRTLKIKDEKVVFAKKVNPVIFDAVSTATSFVIQKRIELPVNDVFEKRYIKLLINTDFISATTNRTTNTENIKARINLATTILFGVHYEWNI
ncbi:MULTISPECIES: DUF262 domain-containing protein [Clostridium]|uniref:DUF262 domain-containing protein n=1 Tax=Clostridium frigoriphilum TaxID=443253 RepID=A0ABU7UQ09_9CLOT|nr:DUF262 domain-containing protein [Clostridium sp. DSM 17811]MBU3100672.1 DUF262 domain-containing protein [Clostridium sp. DSM 17811]